MAAWLRRVSRSYRWLAVHLPSLVDCFSPGLVLVLLMLLVLVLLMLLVLVLLVLVLVLLVLLVLLLFLLGCWVSGEREKRPISRRSQSLTTPEVSSAPCPAPAALAWAWALAGPVTKAGLLPVPTQMARGAKHTHFLKVPAAPEKVASPHRGLYTATERATCQLVYPTSAS
jgi:hypothetical protein